MKAFVPVLAATFLFASGRCATADGFLYTPTAGRICADNSRKSFSAWSCPGPEGHKAEFADEGNIASFGIRFPHERTARSRYTWRGADKVFGDLVEWRVDRGSPTFAVLRIWRTESDSNAVERTVSELVVFQIGSSGLCRIASIDAKQVGANDTAHAIMLEQDLPCKTDKETQ